MDIKFYDSVQNHNLDLKSGRLDTVLATSFYMASWLESEEGQGCEIVGKPVLVIRNTSGKGWPSPCARARPSLEKT